nr:methyltransferase domain-containing protein [Chloroflexota bacterium]
MIDPRPVCNYEGSNYQADFWGKGGREYEDRAEQIALRAFLPKAGGWFLEVGAGAGRQTPLLGAFEHVVLVDYSRTQLQQAQARLGCDACYTYVAANVYKLPFAPGAFDGGMMVRVMHHLVDGPGALKEVHAALRPGGSFILEFANKQNWKAMTRYLLGLQRWSPFSPEPVEFVNLNFDFHPRTVRRWLTEAGFGIMAQRTVSHYRLGLLKRIVPPALLAALDGWAQPTGNWMQFTPSVFVQCAVAGRGRPMPIASVADILRCPVCKGQLQGQAELGCVGCGRRWAFQDGIYDFKEPL